MLYPEIVVVGCGNPLFADDGFGHHQDFDLLRGIRSMESGTKSSAPCSKDEDICLDHREIHLAHLFSFQRSFHKIRQARDILARAKAQGTIGELDEATWRKIYAKRKPEISLEEFMLHEKRKGNRGMVDGTYFDLLFTRDWSQIQQHPAGKPAGESRIEANVINADFAFDSPAIFRLDHPEVKEIFCYSHTYAGQAHPGEAIEAKGVLEETAFGLRLVVGTTREARGEWIRSLTLLEG